MIFHMLNSGSRTRTYDIMINSHALLPTELCRNNRVATSYSHKGNPFTTIGAKKLNFCVRHGNRCDLLAIVTRQMNDYTFKTR